GFDEVVCRNDVVRRVRNDAGPTVATRPRFYSPHQPTLQRSAPVRLQHPHSAEIACVLGMCRSDEPGKCDRNVQMEGEPPMSKVELGHRRAAEEGQFVEV